MPSTSAAAGYKTVETDERVPDIDVELITRFRWRAERRCRCMNERRLVDFYRWEVKDGGGRWYVVAMQNRAVPVNETSYTLSAAETLTIQVREPATIYVRSEIDKEAIYDKVEAATIDQLRDRIRSLEALNSSLRAELNREYA